MTLGWVVPPPKQPVKTKEELLKERKSKVEELSAQGLIRSKPMARAMLKVPREDFVPEIYRDYTYLEVPLPLPGRCATISCPHSYPMFYEALKLEPGNRFLEVGTGSGYGAALAREVVGWRGKVVTIEIDVEVFKFAKRNLEKTGYNDVLVVLGDGTLGYPAEAPYDKICVTASCPAIPEPLIGQLKPGGKITAPVGHPSLVQDLILLEKGLDGALKRGCVEKVLYVPLRGRHGWP